VNLEESSSDVDLTEADLQKEEKAVAESKKANSSDVCKVCPPMSMLHSFINIFFTSY
jgi:hypothetical protein